MYTNPAPIEELMEAIDYKLNEQFEMAINSSVEVLWQPDNVTADMTPPEIYQKYILPFYKKRGEQCRKAGKKYIIHMDGRINALKELIAETPFDAIDSFSFGEMAGDVSIDTARKLWKDKVLCPNFPASLCEVDEETIISFLKEKAVEFGDMPYMMQISEDIPIDSYRKILPLLTDFYNK